MKKNFSFLAILILGVLCSGCINNYAVHKLNKIAAQYIEQGNVQAGISRLESSIDLDDSIYETRYNLAVAYLKENNCDKALENIEKAIELANNSNIKESYYTRGVSYDCLADSVFKEDESDKKTLSIKLTEEQKNQQHIEYLIKANENYEKYLEGNNDIQDIEDVKMQIENNNKKIENINNPTEQ